MDDNSYFADAEEPEAAQTPKSPAGGGGAEKGGKGEWGGETGERRGGEEKLTAGEEEGEGAGRKEGELLVQNTPEK